MSPLEQPSQNPNLPSLLNRLKELGESTTRVGQVNQLIGRFVDDDPALNFKIKQAQAHFRQFENEPVVGQLAKEELQNILTAYLFYQNRLLYQQEGKTNYDFEKEKRQIDAVVAALEGKHIHMGTGEGKSSAVIPVTTIIESLTSEKKDVVVATASQTLLKEIRQKTEKLMSRLSLFDETASLELRQKGKEKVDDYIDDQLFLTMEKDVLIADQFSPETQKKITQAYWRQRLTQPEEEKIFPEKPSTKPRIIFSTERDLVFESATNPQSFQKNCPRIIMDEADVAYNRGTPYVRTIKDRFVTPEEIKNSTYQWLFNYLIAQQITAADFESFQGRQLLKDGVVERLNLNYSQSNQPFEQGLAIIAKKLGLRGDKAVKFRKNASEYFSRNLPQTEDLKMYAQGVGDILAEMTRLRNRNYLLKKDGFPIVRDSYIDELLEEHEHQPEEQLMILALAGRFDFVHLNQAISSAIRFPTFVGLAADKLICLSGTLLYPHPTKPIIESSDFAKFLEVMTNRRVELITPPDQKTTPVPEWFIHTHEAETALMKNLINQKKPVLVLDYEGVDHAQKLCQQIRQHKKNKEKVVLLPPKPSLPEAEVIYNQYINHVTRDLAEGRIDVIVSSGAAGIGIDIVRPDGSFPDLRVVHFGMPEHEMVVTQGDGRRRAPGDDFAWYLSEGILERFISYFDEEKADKLAISLGKIDQLKIRELIKQASSQPEKRLPVILEILKEKRRHGAQNEQITIEYDQLFRKIVDRFRSVLKQKLTSDWPDKNDQQINNLVNVIGVPQSLYYEILNTNPVVPGGGGPRSFVDNLSSVILSESYQEVDDREQKRAWFDQQLDQWYEITRGKLDQFDRLIMFDLPKIFEPVLVSLSPLDAKKLEDHHIYTNAVPLLLPSADSAYLPLGLSVPDVGQVIGAKSGDQLFFITTQDQKTAEPIPLLIEPYEALSFLPLGIAFGPNQQPALALFALPKTKPEDQATK